MKWKPARPLPPLAGLAAHAQSHMPARVGRPLRTSESGLVPSASSLRDYHFPSRTPLMRERSEILKSKSEVMGGGGGLGRLPADRLGRAASMEASGAVAAAANSGCGAAPASHAASPEGLDDAPGFFPDWFLCCWLLSWYLFCGPLFPYPWHFLPISVADPGCFPSRITDPNFFHPGSEFFPSRIPDPNFLHPGSRIRIKEFKYINPKKWKYDRGCLSRIRIPDPDHVFLPLPDPVSRIQGSKRHRTQDPGSGSATLLPI